MYVFMCLCACTGPYVFMYASVCACVHLNYVHAETLKEGTAYFRLFGYS